MTPEGLRARGERFHQELGRESYVTGAGLAAEAHFEEIFERYADLAGDEAADAARAIPALYAWVVGNRVGRAVAALEDRLHAWEAAARVTLPDGTVLPYQRVAVEIANAAERGRRLALDAARRAPRGAGGADGAPGRAAGPGAGADRGARPRRRGGGSRRPRGDRPRRPRRGVRGVPRAHR